jgi:hypothetical protein
LDAPDTLPHVLGRGIEGRAIFRADRDRDDFVRRFGEVAVAKTLAISAWALVPNHLHRLVRTGAPPLARAMRSLLTGSAGAFSRRHRVRRVLLSPSPEGLDRRPGVRSPSIHKAAQQGGPTEQDGIAC